MNKVFVIVEGADRSGKSTFCNDLKSTIEKHWNAMDGPVNVNIVGFGSDSGYVQRDFDILKKDVQNFKYWKDGIYIIDRFILTDLCYMIGRKAPTFGSPSMEFDVLRWLGLYLYFKAYYHVHTVVLNRRPIEKDFSDDKIKMTVDGFNRVVRAYNDVGAHIGSNPFSDMYSLKVSDKTTSEDQQTENVMESNEFRDPKSLLHFVALMAIGDHKDQDLGTIRQEEKGNE